MTVGLAVLWALRDARLALLDTALGDWASRKAREVIPGEPQRRVFMELPTALGAEGSVETLLLVTDESGAVLSRSAQWPPDVDTSNWISVPARDAKPGPVSPEPGPVIRTAPGVPNGTQVRIGSIALQGQAARTAPLDGVPIRIGNDREIAVRHFSTSGKGGMIRWVAAHTSPYTVFAGVRASVVTNSLLGYVWTCAAAACIASIFGAALTNRMLLIRHREQVALSAWVRDAAGGAPHLAEPPGSSLELAELREQLVRLHRRLVVSLEQAYRFTGDAAHELRSPLTVMQVKVDRLISGGLAASGIQADLVDIADDIHRMSVLVRRLSWIALADAGRLQIHRTAVNLSATVREVARDSFDGVDGVSVDLQVQPDIWVDGDSTLIEHAAVNLISNAVKHNRPGGWVSIAATREPDAAVVSVRNSAAHPLPAQRERVFERFYRGSYARSSRDGGSGIGLSLAREIARAHGGDVVARDAPADAACFELRLPLSTSDVVDAGKRLP
jgi:signal transduction histidine kinase